MEEEKMFMRHEDLMAVKISMSRGLMFWRDTLPPSSALKTNINEKAYVS
jgi:hypothetical protein